MDDRSRAERFEAVYRATAANVHAYCLRRGARDLADDVVDEVYLVAWRRLDELPSEPLPWLLGVARKALANQRRSRRRQAALVARLAPEEARAPAEPTGVLAALSELRAADRELLLLVAWDGLSTAEAGRVLGCSAVAARVRLHRARRRLATALESRGHPEPRHQLDTRPREELP